MKQKDTKANFYEVASLLDVKSVEWAKAVPYQVKRAAIADACDAVKAAKKKFKTTGLFNEVHFRSRKNPIQSCFVPGSAISKFGIYRTILKPMKSAEALPLQAKDSRIIFRGGRWFVCIPQEVNKTIADNQGRLVALDPGIRTFQTYFSDEEVGKIGEGDFKRIARLCHQLDKLQSLITKVTARKRRSLKSAMASIRCKIKNLIDELHHQTASFLVKNFDVILLPSFETSQMVMRHNRKLRSKTARAMLNFAHFRFKQFLKHKAFEYNKVVLDVCEAYTSKTCSWSGTLKNISGAKHIRDKDVILDRDINGARGIFLRALVDHPRLLESSSNLEFVNVC